MSNHWLVKEIELLIADRDSKAAELANLQVAFNDWKVFHSPTSLQASIRLPRLEVENQLLAEDARGALGRVASAEADTIEGWLAYGAALNEGRGLFHPDDDKGFGQWVSENLLSQVASVNGAKIVTFDDRAAAMWVSENGLSQLGTHAGKCIVL